jgi:hypothetical protein
LIILDIAISSRGPHNTEFRSDHEWQTIPDIGIPPP